MDLDADLQKLHALIKDAAVVLSSYTGRGFFKRFLLSSYDEGKFTTLTRDIHGAMQVSCVKDWPSLLNSGRPIRPYP